MPNQNAVILFQISPYKIRNGFIYCSSSLLFGVQIKEINLAFFDVWIHSTRTAYSMLLNLCFGLVAEFASLSIVCCLVMASFFLPKCRHVMSPLYNENVSFDKETGGLSLGRGIL